MTQKPDYSLSRETMHFVWAQIRCLNKGLKTLRSILIYLFLKLWQKISGNYLHLVLFKKCLKILFDEYFLITIWIHKLLWCCQVFFFVNEMSSCCTDDCQWQRAMGAHSSDLCSPFGLNECEISVVKMPISCESFIEVCRTAPPKKKYFFLVSSELVVSLLKTGSVCSRRTWIICSLFPSQWK